MKFSPHALLSPSSGLQGERRGQVAQTLKRLQMPVARGQAGVWEGTVPRVRVHVGAHLRCLPAASVSCPWARAAHVSPGKALVHY